MKLGQLIKDLPVVKTIGETDREITGINADSRTISGGNLFICLNGRNSDGHDFARQAASFGAAAVITEREIDTPLTQIIVKNSREAMSLASCEFYRHPDRKMKIIGVTGTNGKTTTAALIYEIARRAGIKCGLIGTLGTFYGDKKIEPDLTTPDPPILQKILSDMAKSGVETVAMEVSAHAAFFDKIAGMRFAAGIFTNFTQDHLDFFGNMDEYKRAKMKFFEDKRCKFVVPNGDDAVGREIADKYPDAITYGIDDPADVFAVNVNEGKDGVEFVMNLFDCIYDVRLNLIGRFNAYNALAAATACALTGIETFDIVRGLNAAQCVSGRLEKVYDGDFAVYVDYAHTPDGLEKALNVLKKATRGKLLCVFGCGGNRDRDKRAKMGAISGTLADFTVITSDNPRYEEPMEIISEIEKGMIKSKGNYVIVQDRAEAIRYAVKNLKSGDNLLIAGKGCEKYQEILGIKRLYNDKDTVTEILRSERR